ncbi:hypothetical protein Sjap_014426 [Stephania japonica]|uniref:G-patch domain-containing protein n=1 Tax=Stephania japonica TaxID=461633 RepID=A0AAP0NRG1_9MAGN
MEEVKGGSSSSAIRSSNIGFQLLKKCGWTEGTGLGVAEQGRLEPIQVHAKNDKQGLGSRKINNNNKNKRHQLLRDSTSKDNEAKKKAKALSKRAKKLQEQEKKLQDKEFERAFFREFWPDNV